MILKIVDFSDFRGFLGTVPKNEGLSVKLGDEAADSLTVARCARFIAPSEPHHVVARGVDGMRIFSNSSEKRLYLKRFRQRLRSIRCKSMPIA